MQKVFLLHCQDMVVKDPKCRRQSLVTEKKTLIDKLKLGKNPGSNKQVTKQNRVDDLTRTNRKPDTKIG